MAAIIYRLSYSRQSKLRCLVEPLPVYDASRLRNTADGGGSRMRLFKVELQTLADGTGLMIQVCHFPTGTSK